MTLAGLRKCTAYSLYQSLWNAVDWIYPPTCIGCGRINQRFCEECQSQIEYIQGQLCPKCGEPSKHKDLCNSCKADPPCFESLRGIAHYAGPIRQCVIKLKYDSDYALAEFLAEMMIHEIHKLGWDLELVTSVPLSKLKHQERGYNQANLLARPIAYALRVPFKPDAITRSKDTRSQVGLSAFERAENLKNAFSADSQIVRKKRILIIDDVTTTGTTINECSRALLSSGANCVFGMTLARPLLGKSSNEL